jgi:membrane-bound serine protease (ClpP class)
MTPPGNRHANAGTFSRVGAICALITFLLIIPTAASLNAADDGTPVAGQKVFVIEVHETIDLGLAFFIKRSLESAENKKADAIILEINTFGGRVDAAVDIRDALDRCNIPTTAYVNMRAISAGALICLAADEITMAPGSTIGAATPIGIGGVGEKMELGEKEKSYVRGEFRATAERNGHSPLLAEAMVDPDTEVWIVLDGGTPKVVSAEEAKVAKKSKKKTEIKVASAKGKLLTMTASEAVEAGLAGSTPESRDELISSLDLDDAAVVVSQISWSEYIVRFLTNPIVSGLLLSLGVLGIFFELQMPGWGISGSIGVTFLLLFFGGHYLAGLASMTDLLLFTIGIALIAAEIFVVPGFGVTGISGLLCILVGIYLALVRKPIPQFSWDYEILNTAMLVFAVFIVAALAGIVIIWKMSPESRFKKLMVLSESLRAEDGYAASTNLDRLVGQAGKSITHLRPAGRALINGEPFEVQSEGDFIEIDRSLTVIRVAGNKVFVAESEKGEEA